MISLTQGCPKAPIVMEKPRILSLQGQSDGMEKMVSVNVSMELFNSNHIPVFLRAVDWTVYDVNQKILRRGRTMLTDQIPAKSKTLIAFQFDYSTSLEFVATSVEGKLHFDSDRGGMTVLITTTLKSSGQ